MSKSQSIEELLDEKDKYIEQVIKEFTVQNVIVGIVCFVNGCLLGIFIGIFLLKGFNLL